MSPFTRDPDGLTGRSLIKGVYRQSSRQFGAYARHKPLDHHHATPRNMSDEPGTLEQLLADWRGDAQVLRRRGHDREAEQVDHFADAVARAAEDYLRWLSEDEAVLRSGRSRGWLRSHFPEWERAGHARREGRKRWYRMLVIPQRANPLAARAAGRRAALERTLS